MGLSTSSSTVACFVAGALCYRVLIGRRLKDVEARLAALAPQTNRHVYFPEQKYPVAWCAARARYRTLVRPSQWTRACLRETDDLRRAASYPPPYPNGW